MTTTEEANREFAKHSPHMTNVGGNDEDPAVMSALNDPTKEGLVDDVSRHAQAWIDPAKQNDPTPDPKQARYRKITFPDQLEESWDQNQNLCNLPRGTIMYFDQSPGEDWVEVSILDDPGEQDGGNPDPKQAWGDKKIPAASLNPLVLLEEAHQTRVGGYLYGVFNYVGEDNPKSAMVYIHALMRHFLLFIGGEDNDPDSLVSHLAAIRCCCGILRTQQIQGSLIDDRPDWGDVRAMVDYLDALWLEIMPKLDEQIAGMVDKPPNP